MSISTFTGNFAGGCNGITSDKTSQQGIHQPYFLKRNYDSITVYLSGINLLFRHLRFSDFVGHRSSALRGTPWKGGELDKLITGGLVEGSVDVGAHTLGTALPAGFNPPSDLQLETVQTLFLSQTPGSSPP